MAKVGEGDSRWIVAQRADGKNVGNWHWTEKNLFPFAEKRAKELFSAVPLISAMDVGEGQRLSASVTRCERCEGESAVMNRKGKVLYLYDMTLTLKYEAKLSSATDADKSITCKADLTIRDIATDETPALKVAQDDSAPSKDAARVAQALRSDAVRATLFRVVDTLVEEMKAQIDGVQAPAVPLPDAQAASAVAPQIAAASPSAPRSGAVASVGTGSVTQTLDCDVPAAELFSAFTDPQRVQAYTGAPARVEPRVSAPLSLYGGAVLGEVLACEPGVRLVWSWRAQSWPQGATSTVTLLFEVVEATRTKLTLTHTNVPKVEVDRTRGFWEEQFWSRMRALFGWRMKAL